MHVDDIQHQFHIFKGCDDLFFTIIQQGILYQCQRSLVREIFPGMIDGLGKVVRLPWLLWC
ncbi:MAG: hypothetical protein WCF90_09065 [Methanomicrobiales archaeon]